MKRISIILFCLLISVACFAQKVKIGHVDYGALMKDMPGIDTVQVALNNFQAEFEETGQQMVKEFQSKQEAYMQLANNGSSAAILKVKEDEIQKLYARIQEFTSISEQEIQNKQLELLQPFTDKIKEAIQKVADANHYAYVFDVSTLAYFSDSDDLMSAVKKELSITK